MTGARCVGSKAKPVRAPDGASMLLRGPVSQTRELVTGGHFRGIDRGPEPARLSQLQGSRRAPRSKPNMKRRLWRYAACLPLYDGGP